MEAKHGKNCNGSQAIYIGTVNDTHEWARKNRKDVNYSLRAHEKIF